MSRSTSILLGGAAVVGLALVLDAAPADADPRPIPVAQSLAAPSFAEDVMPILQENCVSCHGEEDEDGFPYTEAGLSLLSYEDIMKGSEFGPVVEPGNPDDSYLLTMVENGDMPDEGDPLTLEQIEIIREWIAAGAENN